MIATHPLKAKSDFSLIIFGASGHLASLKIFPALYFMALKKRLPEHFSIVGFARSEMDDGGFRVQFAEAVRRNVEGVNEKVLEELLTHVHYQQGQYDGVAGYHSLAARLTMLEKGHAQNAVRVAYLSVPPSVYSIVAKHLCEGGIHALGGAHKGHFRCIVEKPVGNNLRSFESIQQCLTECFTKGELYLLDHYLGKEAARNIYYLRMVNPVVEQILRNTLVNHVQITALESAGLEGRAGYFEAVGTLRDMFQSHMLALMALLTMQLVERKALPSARADALKNIYVPPATDLSEVVLQGQYTGGAGHCGYREEEGVAADSRTPTYIAMKLMSRMARWQGVPFYLRSGKHLLGKETRIMVEFQDAHAVTTGADVPPNRLEIILQGEAGMRLHLQTKKGGSEPEFRPLVLEDPLVCVGDCMDEHGLLLLEAVNGKRDWFLDFSEVMTAWKLIDPLEAYIERPDTALSFYPCSTLGPVEATEWLAREGHVWI